MKTVYIVTDMEGISGIDSWEQCYETTSQAYSSALRDLAADVNATVEGCLKAGATDILVLDGHGPNRQKGLLRAGLHPAARFVKLAAGAGPTRLIGLDENVDDVLLVGQHSMAGTINGFLDHTQLPKEICRFWINGEEHGELSQLALYSGALGVPFVHASGDEALCDEAHRLFPSLQTTATKRGTSWDTCELYPPDKVRAKITYDVEMALRQAKLPAPVSLATPAEIKVEFAWSKPADIYAAIPGVKREHARIVSWKIGTFLDVYSWPSATWQPLT